MTVVSNASPLINLARIGQLDLIRNLYDELVIPEAVWHEIVVAGAEQPGANEVKAAAWIKTRAAVNRQLVQALQQELGSGEAEAIALALEIGSELLLMDEHLGREVAHHLGLRCMGLIGVLIEAKHKGFIREVKPHLDALRDVAGFRVSSVLYTRVLQDEHEE
nr:DUF3368 domain-containing protein [Chloroflexota bacterium]